VKEPAPWQSGSRLSRSVCSRPTTPTARARPISAACCRSRRLALGGVVSAGEVHRRGPAASRARHATQWLARRPGVDLDQVRRRCSERLSGSRLRAPAPAPNGRRSRGLGMTPPAPGFIFIDVDLDSGPLTSNNSERSINWKGSNGLITRFIGSMPCAWVAGDYKDWRLMRQGPYRPAVRALPTRAELARSRWLASQIDEPRRGGPHRRRRPCAKESLPASSDRCPAPFHSPGGAAAVPLGTVLDVAEARRRSAGASCLAAMAAASRCNAPGFSGRRREPPGARARRFGRRRTLPGCVRHGPRAGESGWALPAGYVPLESWWNTGSLRSWTSGPRTAARPRGIVVDARPVTPLAGARGGGPSGTTPGDSGIRAIRRRGVRGEVIDRDVADAEGKFRLGRPGTLRDPGRGHARERAASSRDRRTCGICSAVSGSGRVVDEAGARWRR
jgi:hypothetical protein